MVTELYKRLVAIAPIMEVAIPTVEVPNIWSIPVDIQDEQINEERIEKKRKKKEDRAANKKARLESIQDEAN